jgi:transcriptional regulator with XRE-family HTH domain
VKTTSSSRGARVDAGRGVSIPTDLRDARVAGGGSQEEVAKRLGVTQATLSRWENGLRSPVMADLERWAEAVGCYIAVVPQQQS